MSKQELINELYSHGSSRGMCPKWFACMLQLINEAK